MTALEHIKMIARIKNWSQSDLAAKWGISRVQAWKIINGKAQLTWAHIDKICKDANVKVEFIYPEVTNSN